MLFVAFTFLRILLIESQIMVKQYTEYLTEKLQFYLILG